MEGGGRTLKAYTMNRVRLEIWRRIWATRFSWKKIDWLRFWAYFAVRSPALYFDLEDCNWKLWMKEQYQLKYVVGIDVRTHLIPPKHDCGGLTETLRSLAAWPAGRQGRMHIRRKPTSPGMGSNVKAKTLNPAPSGRPARASQMFVSKSWVEIVLAGGELFG